MLLRIAAILFLALAAARPFLRAAGAGHQPTAVAIVLDNSMSSSVVPGDRRLLDELKDRALETLAAAEAEDIFWLIRAGSPWEPAWPGNAETTRQRVRETEPTSAAADLIGSIERARAVLDAGAAGRAAEIHLLSDLQASNLGRVLAASEGAPPLIVWVSPAELPPNVAVARVDVGGGVSPIAGQRSTVAAFIAGDSSADSVNVRMAIEGRVTAAATAPVGSATILAFPARPAGFVSGWVEKDPDGLRPDDRRWFATRVAPPPSVALGGDLGIAGEAIAVLEQEGRLRRVGLREAEVAILPGARGIESVPPSMSIVVLPPDSALEVAGTNRRLAGAGVRWAFEASSATGASRFDVQNEKDGPLRILEQVRLNAVMRLAPQGAGADTVLLRLADGSAWAVRGTRPGGGRYVLLGSSLSENATNLPTTPALLPLLDRLLGAWVAARSSVTEAAPGDELPLPEGATHMQAPDSVREPASGSYRLAGDPGVYRVLAGDSTVALVAVNPPAAESDLRRADARRVREAFPETRVETADQPEEWARRIFHQRVGREIWRLLALLALAALILEALVAASGVRRTADRTRAASATGSPAGARRETQHAGG
jgi:hypothetical protein